ncbi:MAG: lipoyl synthase [candidate division WOR-3 bacterium]
MSPRETKPSPPNPNEGRGTRKPPWLRVRLPGKGEFSETSRVLRELRLNTVCQEARCPNISDCWGRGTATFMILGKTCTRRCGFCATETGRPKPPDPDEPERVAEAVKRMGIRFAVITSTTRDDLPDGGAGHFAEVIRAVKRTGAMVEVLVPDFGGDPEAIKTVLGAGPDVFAHNTETTRRLTPLVRDGRADYGTSLEVLRIAAQHGSALVKSGFMVGLGETEDEIYETLRDIREAGAVAITIGQYLQPTMAHLPVARFVEPERFALYARWAKGLGYEHIASGPLVRSSYRAEEIAGRFLRM